MSIGEKAGAAGCCWQKKLLTDTDLSVLDVAIVGLDYHPPYRWEEMLDFFKTCDSGCHACVRRDLHAGSRAEMEGRSAAGLR